MSDHDYEPTPKTEDELLGLIREELDIQADSGGDYYEKSADALWKCAVAAFNYAADKVGATGFQAGWAGMQFLRVTRRMEGPFGILDGHHLLYPQYDLEQQAREWVARWRHDMAPVAAEKLAALEARDGAIHPDVEARWRELAALASGEPGE